MPFAIMFSDRSVTEQRGRDRALIVMNDNEISQQLLSLRTSSPYKTL